MVVRGTQQVVATHANLSPPQDRGERNISGYSYLVLGCCTYLGSQIVAECSSLQWLRSCSIIGRRYVSCSIMHSRMDQRGNAYTDTFALPCRRRRTMVLNPLKREPWCGSVPRKGRKLFEDVDFDEEVVALDLNNVLSILYVLTILNKRNMNENTRSGCHQWGRYQ